MGELQEALNAKQKALSIFRENKGVWSTNSLPWRIFGHIYEELGEPQKALDYHHQALNLPLLHHNRDLEIPMLSVIAGAYAAAGDKDKALGYYNTALALAHGDQRFEPWTLSKLGGFYLGQGEYDKAFQLFDQILPLFHKGNAPVFEAATLYGMGVIYHRRDKLMRALEALNQALSINPFNNRTRREILREIGAVYEDLGDRPKAFEYYEKSLTESRAAKDLLEEALTLCDRLVPNGPYGTPEARRDVEAGLQILESVRARIAGPESRSSYFAAAQRNFEFYIDLLMQMHAEHPDQGLDAAALEASERARAAAC